ncbi:phospholipase A2 group XV-like, partial [Sitodiplosis mosellana]|uniref:phospholipase A2 group XV-like n=1 Tax=Sitodiplosis mosellana TaxID=263140 RepID=UPI002444521A
TEPIEWVDTTPILDYFDFGAYFYYVADALVKNGYVRGETLFGAPYDFRKGPNENGEWFERLAYLTRRTRYSLYLTEYVYSINNNIGITFIAHSMGGRMLLYFLQEMPQEWKDVYVKRVIALSVPWSGSTNTLKALSVGYNFGINLVNSQKMKEVEETYPSVVWLLPSEYFWKENEVLIIMNC